MFTFAERIYRTAFHPGKKEKMKNIVICFLLSLILFSCKRKDFVFISGRIENGDSVVVFWMKDSIYSFPVQADCFFSGKIYLKGSTYASFMPGSWDLYLSPGENLEINADVLNIPASLSFSGSLGGFNTYLKEQEMMASFDKDYYYLDEREFVEKMKGIMNERVELLEAKNFNKDFTQLEKLRILYSIGQRVAVYPLYHKQYVENAAYVPGEIFYQYLSAFPLNNEKLFVTRNYRKFLLNYVYFQGAGIYPTEEDYANKVADYILSNFADSEMRDFLLSEVVYRYIWENNGLEGAEQLLAVFRQKCKDEKKVAYIDEIVKHWEKLLPGNVAPDFRVESQEGEEIRLSDFKGHYVYMGVWASWCLPCKKELAYFKQLEEQYQEKNICFLTVSIDGEKGRKSWEKLLSKKQYGGIHSIATEDNCFRDDYMIISVPRFILIDTAGLIISSNAPRPSGKIDDCLDFL